MDLSGPRPISPVNALPKSDVSLRPTQRVAAQILEVIGTTAVLSIEGIPIVAQLTSTDQAATLLTQQTAQFLVTQLNHQKITLKLIKDDQIHMPVMDSASTTRTPELIIRLLEQNHLPATVSNLMMARALLRQHLPVTNSLISELAEALSEYGPWGSKEADAAAALQAARLPLSGQSIALASRQPAKISDSISQLIRLLNDMASPDLPPEVLKQLELNMWLLNGIILDGEEETARLAEQFKMALETLGRSLENDLFEGSQNSESSFSEISLRSLARLQKMLEQVGRNEAAEAIGEFLEDLRLNQFLNAKPEWLEINLPIQNTKTDEGLSTARLRITRESKSKSINLDSTRIILQVDINSDETVEVDLTVMGRQLRILVTAPNPIWSEHAENELSSLEQAFQGLGFMLKETKICTNEAKSFADSGLAPDREYLMAVDIEV